MPGILKDHSQRPQHAASLAIPRKDTHLMSIHTRALTLSMLNRVVRRKRSELSDTFLITSDMPLQDGPSAETCRRCISGGVSEEYMACLERLQQAAGDVWYHDHQLKVDNPMHFWTQLKAKCTPEDIATCFWRGLYLQCHCHPVGTLLACLPRFLQGHQSPSVLTTATNAITAAAYHVTHMLPLIHMSS